MTVGISSNERRSHHMSKSALTFLAIALTVHAATSACEVLSEADAVKLLKNPLGSIKKSETMPDATNGNDHMTICGYFPKGYDLETADGPPDAGLMVTLHTMPDAAAAKRYYEGVMGTLKESGEKLKPVTGVGDAGYSQQSSTAGLAVHVTILTFFKGNVMAMVQVWAKATPDEIARAASLQIAGRLPLRQ
jgi:hypothetical protein